MENIFNTIFITGLLAATIRMATPILIASLGEIFSELSGILNIGIEGTMLAGSLAGFIGTYYTGSIIFGIIAGIITGGMFGLIMAILSIKLKANQIACGIILNLLSLGLTGFLFRIIFGISTLPPGINTLKQAPVPFFNKIPLIGEILFNQNIMVYLAFFLTIISYIIIYKTTWGLKLRSAGEYPEAADASGINVYKIRYICVITGGMFAGLGGTFLTMELGMFMDNMTSGRGFIALAAVIFGKWNPFGAMGGALLFGLADAFQLRLQTLGYNIPHELLLMFPYILTIIMLTGLVGKSKSPSALTVPYIKNN